ncbi:hypothetical protein [Croceicoccus hydrothermalis]|uniref:hypothetical protein n=1 Tax=Croceicoccus hydrothermalis TaxID=2867964 RepID=UPI001EFA6CF4|nr:hypothetical protein [Croceicoccus hydrothermalis]
MKSAIATMDSALAIMASKWGSKDKAYATCLSLIATNVVDSWSRSDESQHQTYGDALVREPTPAFDPIKAFANDTARSEFSARRDLIEGTGRADGLIHRELAAWILQNEMFDPVWSALSYLSSVDGRFRLNRPEHFNSLARAFLERLCNHTFSNWSANASLAFPGADNANEPPTMNLSTGPKNVTPIREESSKIASSKWQKTLSEALHYWKEQRRPGRSAITEATRSVERYINLFGDPCIADISSDDILEFRDLLADMPPQTELAKLTAAGITLREKIEEHRALREAWEVSKIGPEPARVSPGTVKKDIGSLSAILGKIKKDAKCGENLASDIEIAGYSKTRSGQKKPRLPFTPRMMQILFDSPLFTGCEGHSDIKRTRPGNLVIQDELYWLFFFGVMAGPRLGEMSQILLDDIEEIDLRRTFGNKFSGKATCIRITGTGKNQSTKTESSERNVVIHDKLIEIGFNEYVCERRNSGHDKLFDIDTGPNSYGKKELSRRLNRYVDRVIIDDGRYVFYSTRHEFNDRAEMSKIPLRVVNSIKGHANKTVGENYGLVSIEAQYMFLKDLRVDFIDWKKLKEAKANSDRLRQ